MLFAPNYLTNSTVRYLFGLGALCKNYWDSKVSQNYLVTYISCQPFSYVHPHVFSKPIVFFYLTTYRNLCMISNVDHYSNFNGRIVFHCLNFHFCNQSSNVEVQQNYFRNQQCGPALCTSPLFPCSDSLGEIPEKCFSGSKNTFFLVPSISLWRERAPNCPLKETVLISFYL